VLCADLRRSVGRNEVVVAAWDGRQSHRMLVVMCDGGGESWTLGSTMLPEWLCPVAGMLVTGMELDSFRV
jgi:hypothetical protein